MDWIKIIKSDRDYFKAAKLQEVVRIGVIIGSEVKAESQTHSMKSLNARIPNSMLRKHGNGTGVVTDSELALQRGYCYLLNDLTPDIFATKSEMYKDLRDYLRLYGREAYLKKRDIVDKESAGLMKEAESELALQRGIPSRSNPSGDVSSAGYLISGLLQFEPSAGPSVKERVHLFLEAQDDIFATKSEMYKDLRDYLRLYGREAYLKKRVNLDSLDIVDKESAGLMKEAESEASRVGDLELGLNVVTVLIQIGVQVVRIGVITGTIASFNDFSMVVRDQDAKAESQTHSMKSLNARIPNSMLRKHGS
ncbi:hypothetical protein Tco_0324450 [Tanacetum coccineum]